MSASTSQTVPKLGPSETEFEPAWWSELFWTRQQKIRERVLQALATAGRAMTAGEILAYSHSSGSAQEIRHALERMAYNGLIVRHYSTFQNSAGHILVRDRAAYYGLLGQPVPSAKGGARA